MAERPFDSVAVLGLGVMGGSLARALSALDDGPNVAGWSPSVEERAGALDAGVVSSAPEDWREAASGAELVVVAAPLGATCDLLGQLARETSSQTLFSDVASLKAPVARAAENAGVADRWVGSHPMTGSEESGFGASRADLYSDARVWTVAHPAAGFRLSRMHDFWSALGGRPEAIDALEHDHLMALASHLPQLVSNVLAEVLGEHHVPPEQLGPGGADMTRLAASSASMWRDILEHASPDLIRGLRDLARASTRVAELLEHRDLDGLEALMNATRRWSHPS
ncbi:MAG: prephenate dehydrogenase/arogenate dehydrogenase family protein [Gemmatimonadota bacterium]